MGEEAEESPPCPYFNRGHCRGISNGNCRLSHNAQTCWEEKCEKRPTCNMRHPRSCNLFFRSSRGCHRKDCSHRHLPTQEAPTKPAHTVLIAAGDDQRFEELNNTIAAQQTLMSELRARLAAQEIQTQKLLNSISKLGCKQGNTEKSFKELLEHQDIKLVGEIGCLDIQVERNKKTMEGLKTDVSNTTEKLAQIIDEKLEAQEIQILHKVENLSAVDNATVMGYIQEVLQLQKVDNTKELKYIQEKLQKVDNTKELENIQEKLQKVLPPENDALVLLSAFKRNLSNWDTRFAENFSRITWITDNQTQTNESLQNRLGKLEGKVQVCQHNILSNKRTNEKLEGKPRGQQQYPKLVDGGLNLMD